MVHYQEGRKTKGVSNEELEENPEHEYPYSNQMGRFDRESQELYFCEKGENFDYRESFVFFVFLGTERESSPIGKIQELSTLPDVQGFHTFQET